MCYYFDNLKVGDFIVVEYTKTTKYNDNYSKWNELHMIQEVTDTHIAIGIYTKSGRLIFDKSGNCNIFNWNDSSMVTSYRAIESPSKKILFDAALYEINKRNKSTTELYRLIEILKENVH